jgi:hypothetical protein
MSSETFPDIELWDAVPDAGICIIWGRHKCGKTNLLNNIVWLKTPAGRAFAAEQQVTKQRRAESKGESKIAPLLVKGQVESKCDVKQPSRSSVLTSEEYPIAAACREFDDTNDVLVAMMRIDAMQTVDRDEALFEFTRTVSQVSAQWSNTCEWNADMTQLVKNEECLGSVFPSGVSRIVCEYAAQQVTKALLVSDDFSNFGKTPPVPESILQNKCLFLTCCENSPRVRANGLPKLDTDDVAVVLWFPTGTPDDMTRFWRGFVKDQLGDQVDKLQSLAAFTWCVRQAIAGIGGYTVICAKKTITPTEDGQESVQWQMFRCRAPHSPSGLAERIDMN